MADTAKFDPNAPYSAASTPAFDPDAAFSAASAPKFDPNASYSNSESHDERYDLTHPEAGRLPQASKSSYEVRPVLPSGERAGSMQARADEQPGTVGEQQAIAKREAEHPLITAVGKPGELSRYGAALGRKMGANIIPVSDLLAEDAGFGSGKALTEEQARKQFPRTTGALEGAGQTIGGFVSDPLNIGLTVTGAEAPALLQKAVSGYIGYQLGKGALEKAMYLQDHWQEMSPEQRSEYLTTTGLDTAFAALAAKHTASDLPVTVNEDLIKPTGDYLQEKGITPRVKNTIERASTPKNIVTGAGALIPGAHTLGSVLGRVGTEVVLGPETANTPLIKFGREQFPAEPTLTDQGYIPEGIKSAPVPEAKGASPLGRIEYGDPAEQVSGQETALGKLRQAHLEHLENEHEKTEEDLIPPKELQAQALERLRGSHLKQLLKDESNATPETEEPESEELIPENKPGNLRALKAKEGKIVDTDPYNLQELIHKGLTSDKPTEHNAAGGLLGKLPAGMVDKIESTAEAVEPLIKEATGENKPLQLFKEGQAKQSPRDWLIENPSESDDHTKLEAIINDLPKSEFQAAAKKAGVPLDQYDVREAQREGGSKHPTGRQMIGRQIVQKMTPEAVENFLRSQEDEPPIAPQDRSGASRADRAKRTLRNLYNSTPIDKFGNPVASGGSQGATVDYEPLIKAALNAGPAWTPAKADPIVSELSKIKGNEFEVRGSVAEGRSTDNDLDVWQKSGKLSDAAPTLKRLGFKYSHDTSHGQIWAKGSQHIDLWDSAHPPRKGFGKIVQ